MNHKLSLSKVWIAGAGPGDVELITVKAMRAIEIADVILYDALVNEEFLKAAKGSCKLVYVGKRKNKKEFSQEEINQLIVFYAYRYKNVLRLKGGDPYVFGRGHEELEYISKRGIYAELIPGISSAIAAPAAAGIPVTKRGVNESFWVITGMLADGKFSHDLPLAAQSSATIVILMGMTHLEEMMKLFQIHRSHSEPVAVIQYATCKENKFVIGTVATIASLVKEENISAPAVIVVGKVVEERIVKEILERESVKINVTL